MTAEIINLRRFRKAKERAEKAERAEENRLLHGRTRAARVREESERRTEIRTLDGKRLGDPAEPPAADEE